MRPGSEGGAVVFNLLRTWAGWVLSRRQGRLHADGDDRYESAAGGARRRSGSFFCSSSACVYAADKQTEPDVTALKECDAYRRCRGTGMAGRSFSANGCAAIFARTSAWRHAWPAITTFTARMALMKGAGEGAGRDLPKSDNVASRGSRRSRFGVTASRRGASLHRRLRLRNQALIASECGSRSMWAATSW